MSRGRPAPAVEDRGGLPPLALSGPAGTAFPPGWPSDRPVAPGAAAEPPSVPVPAPPRRPRPPRRRRVPARDPSEVAAPPGSLPAVPIRPAAPAAPPLSLALPGGCAFSPFGELAGCAFSPFGELEGRGRATVGGTGSAAGAGRESPIFGRCAGAGRRPAGLSSGAGASASTLPRDPRAVAGAQGSTVPSAAPFAEEGRSGGVPPGTRSAGAGGPVIESDIGKIPSRGRARARRAHPAGRRRRANPRSGAPAWGACISDEHGVPILRVMSAAVARGAVPVEQHSEDGADDERGSRLRGLQWSLRCHPKAHPTAVAPTRASVTPRPCSGGDRPSGSGGG